MVASRSAAIRLSWGMTSSSPSLRTLLDSLPYSPRKPAPTASSLQRLFEEAGPTILAPCDERPEGLIDWLAHLIAREYHYHQVAPGFKISLLVKACRYADYWRIPARETAMGVDDRTAAALTLLMINPDKLSRATFINAETLFAGAALFQRRYRDMGLQANLEEILVAFLKGGAEKNWPKGFLKTVEAPWDTPNSQGRTALGRLLENWADVAQSGFGPSLRLPSALCARTFSPGVVLPADTVASMFRLTSLYAGRDPSLPASVRAMKMPESSSEVEGSAAGACAVWVVHAMGQHFPGQPLPVTSDVWERSRRRLFEAGPEWAAWAGAWEARRLAQTLDPVIAPRIGPGVRF